MDVLVRCLAVYLRISLASTSMGGASVPFPATHLLLVLKCGHLDTAVRRSISTSPTPRRDVNAFWGVMCLARILLLCGEGVGFQCTAVSKTLDGFWLLASFGTFSSFTARCVCTRFRMMNRRYLFRLLECKLSEGSCGDALG